MSRPLARTDEGRSVLCAEVLYDPRTDDIVLKEPGWIGSYNGFRYMKAEVHTDLAWLVTEPKEIKRFVFVGLL